MEVLDAIKQRKSIRRYLDKKVPEKLIRELIDAARLAPSGCNKQGARYKVISDRDTIRMLKDNGVYTQDFVYTAPVLILCCYDRTAYPVQKKEGRDSIYGTGHIVRGIRDLSIASSFLVLRAEELGLGTCYVGWMDKPKAKRLLDIPDNVEILFTITAGYSADGSKETPRKTTEEILL